MIFSPHQMMSVSFPDIFSSSSVFRRRSLPIKRRGWCFVPDGPPGTDLEIEDLNIGEGVGEYWCPSALIPPITTLMGGMPLVPVCWTPATILMPSSWLDPEFYTGADGLIT